MNNNECTKERFLEVVKDHKLTIIYDNDINRHIRLQNKNGDYCGRYDIITWDNHLCITGDYGSYLFQRTTDMFNFFRNEELKINSYYWAEKCIAESVFGNGIREFSVKRFKERIIEYYKNWLSYNLTSLEEIKEVKEEIRNMFAYAEDEYSCVEAYRNFSSEYLDLSDFWEDSCMEKTYHFIWCLYAIVFGIQKYDEYKK